MLAGGNSPTLNMRAEIEQSAFVCVCLTLLLSKILIDNNSRENTIKKTLQKNGEQVQ
jgi:hypothetical protein